MPKFKIKGESVVQWELVFAPKDNETDYLKATERAKEYVNDMLQLDIFGEFEEADVTGQDNRVFKVIEVD